MVRARPLNARENASRALCIMEMGATWVKLTDPTIASSMSEAHFDSQAEFRASTMRAASGKRGGERAARRSQAAKSGLSRALKGMDRAERAIFDTTFHFDDCFWSADGDAPVSQQDIFDAVSPAIFDNIAAGYNSTILAYGQTGSGKSYTMFGGGVGGEGGGGAAAGGSSGASSSSGAAAAAGGDPSRGLVPRIIEGLLEMLSTTAAGDTAGEATSAPIVHVSCYELYNDQVRDLLAAPSGGASSAGKRRASRKSTFGGSAEYKLRVRQSKTVGVFVEGLQKVAVTSPQVLKTIVRRGLEARSTAATLMNANSSRSHAIVEVECVFRGRRSRLHLVDLAGSEKTADSGV